jgi:methionyl-tRNA formyltransferase
MNYIIVSEKKWNKNLNQSLRNKMGGEWFHIDNKEDLNEDYLKKVNPDKIFIPHWSYIIPASVVNNYECIIFHMTDVPYGRGGSPLQNLIARGFKHTKLTALRAEESLDTGDVYLKKDLPLYGTAEEIYNRSSKLIEKMIEEIIQTDPQPQPQQGEATTFKRRKPKDGKINELNTLEEVFDYIRMLDAEGYPRAFFENEQFRFEFERASYKTDRIKADVTIFKK